MTHSVLLVAHSAPVMEHSVSLVAFNANFWQTFLEHRFVPQACGTLFILVRPFISQNVDNRFFFTYQRYIIILYFHVK